MMKYAAESPDFWTAPEEDEGSGGSGGTESAGSAS